MSKYSEHFTPGGSEVIEKLEERVSHIEDRVNAMYSMGMESGEPGVRLTDVLTNLANELSFLLQSEKSNELEIGDRIDIELLGEKHTATAICREVDGMLFILDECLDHCYQMNETNTTEGGYENSDLRKVLQQAETTIPMELREKMIPDKDGDLLWLLSKREVFGVDENGNKVGGQIEYFKNEKNRVATAKGETYPWWLRDVVSASHFADVSSRGDAGYGGAATAWIGVRPAFKIRDIQDKKERS